MRFNLELKINGDKHSVANRNLLSAIVFPVNYLFATESCDRHLYANYCLKLLV